VIPCFNYLMVASDVEWPDTLDIPAIMASGWRPSPFREFIVKIHSRCDLSCDYCYIYEMADQSWRERPRVMSDDIAGQTAARIAEHAKANATSEITLILHGGEPLLAGSGLISKLVTETRKHAAPDVQVIARVQTNAVGLNEAYLRLFRDLDVKIGISLDGAAEDHDRHRRFASGRGSYTAVAAALERLSDARFRHLFGGLLCTVDVRNDPIETYQGLCRFNPPRIDFLLPHGTWDAPPPGRTPGSPRTPYGDWLTTIFDHWYTMPRTRIRLFEEIIHLLLGRNTSGESVGLSPARMVVVETDGSLEQVDSLKAVRDGAAWTGLHVSRDPFDAALLTPGVVARQLGVKALSAQCRTCPIHRVCGGGLYVHRFRSGTGFANPSVYCPDLMRLILHISAVVRSDIDQRLSRSA
jgi:uncharacterized protein